MATSIGKLNILLTGSVGGLTAALKTGKKEIGDFTGSVRKGINSLGPVFAGLGASALAGVGAFAAFAKSSIDRIGNLKDEADALGVTTQALSRLQYAASFAGVEGEALNGALGKMLKTTADAAIKGGKAAAAFNQLGLDAGKLANLSPEQEFAAIAEAMKGITNPAERVQIAMAIFGKSGKSLLPVLAQGAEGFAAMSAQADALGVTVSAVDAETVDRAGDAFDNVWKILEGIGNTVAAFVAPMVEDMSNQLLGAATNGSTVGEKTTAALEMVVSAIAYASDYLRVFEAGWYGLKAGVLIVTAGVIKYIDLWGAAVVKVMNLLPGVEMEWTDTFASMSESIANEASEAWDKAGQAAEDFADGKSSQAVADYFNRVRDEARKTSEEAVKANEGIGKSIKAVEQTDAEREDEYIKQRRAAMKLAEEEEKWLADVFADDDKKPKAEKQKAADKAIEVNAPKLLQAGSNEAFKVINEIQNNANGGTGKVEKEQLAEQRKGNQYLAKIADKQNGSLAMATINA